MHANITFEGKARLLRLTDLLNVTGIQKTLDKTILDVTIFALLRYLSSDHRILYGR
jgi:hypothetical protein